MRQLAAVLLCVSASLLAVGIGWLADDGGRSLWGLPLLPGLAVIAITIQLLAFLPAFLWQTEHYYDLTGSLTYALVVVLALSMSDMHTRGALLTLLVIIWCLRLGSHLFRRVRLHGKDGRFDEIKKDWGRYLIAWVVQGLWVFLTLLAALIAITDAEAGYLDAWAMAGASLWLIGFTLEVMADRQKAAFKADPRQRGRFIQTGLWAWSRHPNYFGEVMLWSGVCLIALPAFEGWQWLGLISPLFVTWLLLRVSGVPILERRADEQWGGTAEYERYKANTPVLLLRPPRNR